MNLAIVIPVLNDWDSLGFLVNDLRLEFQHSATLHFVVVDDGSTVPLDSRVRETLAAAGKTSVIHLQRTLGHQRAIALGLVHATRSVDFTHVAVMDADGEDTASGLRTLVTAALEAPHDVILARRGRRRESRWFRLGYVLYRAVFRTLTGVEIRHGNFAILPRSSALSIVNSDSLGSHFAATLVRSNLPKSEIRIDRGSRYVGTSKMNTYGLITHGLSAMSVFADRVFIRVVMASAALFLLSLTAFAAVILLRIATDAAVPGWATTAAGIALLFALQILSTSVLATFIVIQQRLASLPTAAEDVPFDGVENL